MPFMLTALCVACNKEEYGKQADGNPVQITVIAEVEQLANTLDTKTYIDGYDILWSENEQMTIYLLNGTNAIDCKSDYFEGAGLPSAKFGFNFSSGEIPENGPYVLGGIYPSSADKGVTDNTTNDKVDLPSIQSPTATSYDPAAYILVAKPETFDEIPAEWTASYRRAAALNKISLTGIGEDIISVDITVPDGKDLAGRRYIDLSTGKSGEIYYGGTRDQYRLCKIYKSSPAQCCQCMVYFLGSRIVFRRRNDNQGDYGYENLHQDNSSKGRRHKFHRELPEYACGRYV